jgi:hypothetical protein
VNPLRRFLLGSGRLGPELRTAVENEGIVLLAEELSGSITYRNYRAPGRRSTLRKRGQNGAIAISGRRLVVTRANNWKEVDVPLDDPKLGCFAVGLDEPDRFCLSWEASDFHDDRSGTVELRFSTPEAGRVVELLQARGVKPR